MKYLVLGASGFLGKHLIKSLLADGHHVTAFDRVACQMEQMDRLTLVEGSFSQDFSFEELVSGHDKVFHLISTSIPSSQIELSREISENVFTTLSLLDACVAEGIQELIFISSGGTVYGMTNQTKSPFKEDDPTNPIASYGIQKLMIEKYLELYYHHHGLSYKIVRLSNPYGMGQNPKGAVGAITVFLDRILNDQPLIIYGDGSNIRDYIYIEDAIQGIINIAQLDKGDKLFNLGVGQGTSLVEIIDQIEHVLSKKATIYYEDSRGTDLPYSVLNISRYKSYFPEHTMLSVKEGIKQYVEQLRGSDNESH